MKQNEFVSEFGNQIQYDNEINRETFEHKPSLQKHTKTISKLTVTEVLLLSRQKLFAVTNHLTQSTQGFYRFD
ncbi:MAG: hypothetical protein ACE5NG_09830 [bacterium]